MDNQSSTTQAKPTFSPYQEGVKKALKQMGEQHTVEALQNGVPPEHIEQQSGLSQQDILNQILQLSKTQVPQKPQADAGMMSGHVGLIGGLINGMQGKGFNPMAQKMESLGMTNAIQLQGAMQSGQKNAMDAQKAPLEMQKLKGDLAAQPVELESKKLGMQRTQQEIESNKPENQLAMKSAEKKIQEGDADLAKTASTAAQNVFDTRSKVFLKGPIGNVAGATLSAWPMKIGSAERAEYDSAVNQFVFDVGNLLGQKGRAFSQNEQEMVRDHVLKAGLSRTEGEFKGGMKSIFNRINSKAGEKIISFNDKTGKVEMKSSSTFSPEKEAKYQAWKKSQMGG